MSATLWYLQSMYIQPACNENQALVVLILGCGGRIRVRLSKHTVNLYLTWHEPVSLFACISASARGAFLADRTAVAATQVDGEVGNDNLTV